MTWPKVKLGEVLRHRKEFIRIEDFSQYKRCRVQLHSRGVLLRDRVLGSEIKTKKQQVCKAGDFLVAEIDAKHGGYGMVPDDLDGAVVSSHYFLFENDATTLDGRYLGWFIRTPAFFEQVAAQGSTNYAAIRPGHVLEYDIPLPSLTEQRRLVARIDALAEKIDEVKQVADANLHRAQSFLEAVFREISESAHRQRLGDVSPLNRRPATMDFAAEYPQISVRSFGRGTFHNPPLKGSEITWEKPHRVEAGDILISNIKAWEGAIAVVNPEDAGRYGSHRYLTYVPVPGLVTARYLCFYLLTPEGLFHVGEASPGSADRNRTTSAKKFQEIPVPVPSFKCQVWFGKLYSLVLAARAKWEEAAIARDALLPAILDKAFRGEL